MLLETERLRLRPHTKDDLDHVVALAQDPSVTRYICGLPATREEAWHRLLRYIGHWSVFGWGMFALFDKSDGSFVGEAGFAMFCRGLGAHFDPHPEAAWMMLGSAHGRGLALEATTSLHAWLSSAHPVYQKTVCIIDPSNRGSVRLADRLGYRRTGEGQYRQSPIFSFERQADAMPDD